MKKTVLAVIVCAYSITHAQSGRVGINTDKPNVTLDVAASPDDPTRLDGLQAPRLTGDQLATKLYGTSQSGALVYVTAPAQNKVNQVVNVSDVGYYYFDGNVWKSIGSLAEKDNLFDVVKRGNYMPRFISFSRNDNNSYEGSTTSALGVTPNYSYYFGNFNQASTGVLNAAFGFGAGESLTSGRSNVLLGCYAGKNITTGHGNNLMGESTGLNLSTGFYNTLLGANSAQKLVTGNYNVAIGQETLFSTVSGFKNTAIGSNAGANDTTGNLNVFIGYNSGVGRTWGSYNTVIGSYAGNGKMEGQGSFKMGSNNIIIGNAAGYNDSDLNNALIIDSNYTNQGATNAPKAEGSLNPAISAYGNALISGNFKDRSLKFNGSVIINPQNVPSGDYTKSVVAKEDGTIGFEKKLIVPIPPSDGTYVLKSTNGNLQWISQ